MATHPDSAFPNPDDTGLPDDLQDDQWADVSYSYSYHGVVVHLAIKYPANYREPERTFEWETLPDGTLMGRCFEKPSAAAGEGEVPSAGGGEWEPTEFE